MWSVYIYIYIIYMRMKPFLFQPTPLTIGSVLGCSPGKERRIHQGHFSKVLVTPRPRFYAKAVEGVFFPAKSSETPERLRVK